MSPKKSPHPWRENLEALATAVIVALTLKYFVLEISKIPSGSMQPTLMGMGSEGLGGEAQPVQIFDRVLVDKLCYRFRDPRRFEVVVFKHPLERSRNMVKRIVGMPGEELRIAHGDLWTRAGEGQPWAVQRRPPAVQEAMWRELDPAGWKSWAEAIHLRDGALLRYTTPGFDSVVNGDFDGYPESLRRALALPHARYRAGSMQPVGDLRVEARVEAGASLHTLVLELREGERLYRFEVPGPQAPPGERARIEPGRQGYGGETPEPAVCPEPYRLEAGVPVRVAAQNLDDRLTLEIDGQPVLALDVPPAPDQRSSVRVAAVGGEVALHGLTALRDVHYLDRGPSAGGVAIPPGHYFMLGDNTKNSADSREWQAVTFLWSEDGERDLQRGNDRRGGNHWENPARSAAADATYFLRNEWGDRYTFRRSQILEEVGPEPAPLVPRELVHGRVFAVFWPLKPWARTWRLGWIR